MPSVLTDRPNVEILTLLKLPRFCLNVYTKSDSKILGWQKVCFKNPEIWENLFFSALISIMQLYNQLYNQ